MQGFIVVARDGAPETGMRPKFLAVFGMATEQASKLGLGTNKSLISIFGSYQVSTQKNAIFSNIRENSRNRKVETIK